MGIEIRQAKFNDWPAIKEFIVSTYGVLAPYKSFARYKWQYHDNPHVIPKLDCLPLWIAIDGRLVIGAIGVQYGTLRILDQEVEASWLIDVMIRPEYRGRKLGHKIYKTVADDNAILVTLTMAPATRRINERAGCITLGTGFQYSKIVAPRKKDIERFLVERTKRYPYLQAAVKALCLTGAVSTIVPVTHFIGKRKLSSPDPSITIKEVEQFGRYADTLWSDVKGDYPIIFVRNARHLVWRFGSPPNLIYKKYVAIRSGRSVGILVLRNCLPEELRLGVISELFAAKGDVEAWNSLIYHALIVFGNKVASVEAAATIPELYYHFKHAGFIASRKVRPTILINDPSVHANLNQYKEKCYFNKGDHDWDQVHALD